MIEDEILQRINYFLEYKRWSIYKLAKQSDIPYSSLNNSFLRKTCPTLPTLEKICNGFNISLSEFFNYKENPLRCTEISEVEQNILNSYQSLSQKDKELLNAYLNGLCKR